MRPEPGRRLFFESLDAAEAGAEFHLDKAARQHARVLRIKDGAPVELFDGQGRLAIGVLRGNAVVVNEIIQAAPPSLRLGIIQGLPKGSKSDDIVRMATELGATCIHFVHSERSITHSRDRRKEHEKRLERWIRIGREATRQCERLYVPIVHIHASLDEAIAGIPQNAARYYAWARHNEQRSTLAEARSCDAWVAVGPEGGFSDKERATFEDAGFQALSLGPHVLRVDTAACAALSLVRALSETST